MRAEPYSNSRPFGLGCKPNDLGEEAASPRAGSPWRTSFATVSPRASIGAPSVEVSRIKGTRPLGKGSPVSDPSSSYPPGNRTSDYTPGEGWLLFAGVMLFLAGLLNVIWGIAAIDDSAFFTDEGRYVLFDDLNTWGWFFLLVGILQLVAVVLDLEPAIAYGRRLRHLRPPA